MRRIAPSNQVPNCPGWAYGLALLSPDGSLYGKRTVEVYRPDGKTDSFTVVSTQGWLDIHRQTAVIIRGGQPMRRTALRGHALQYEGRALVPIDVEPRPRVPIYRLTFEAEGIAYCECGEASPELPSTAARQRWHRDVHKPAVRAQSNG